MKISVVPRPRLWVIGLVVLLAAGAGLPTRAGAFCNGSFFITQHGFCSTSTTQACGIPSLGDAECPAGETCVNDPRVVSFINPCSPTASPACNAATAQARIKLDLGAGPISASPFKLTVNRVRFDLDCVGSPSLPCTDQGDIVRYLGDSTITSNCTTAAGNITWTSTTAQGGNEIVFNPTDGSGNPRPVVINQNTTPGNTTGGGCSLFFNIQVVSQEPASGPLSDSSPGEIEQITGYNTASSDATCAINQPSGSQQTNNIPICPSCTVDDCNLGCDQTTGSCTAKDDSTPCTDSDSNLCTTAGCEKNAAGVGVCLQTHKQKTDCTVDECNLGCVPATGLCTPKDDSTPCSDTDGRACTTAGCEADASGVGQCVQTHVETCRCMLDVQKTACVAAAPAGQGCTGGAIALTLKYTGSTISGPTTVTVTGSNGPSVTYDLPSLTTGDILTKASENGFTIDATAHGKTSLGSKTTVTINGTPEILHTSCSCRATPDTNLALCDPMCLDSSSPDNTTGFKGAPSPLWTLVGLKDPKLGTETCGSASGDCQADLPAGGGQVSYTYTITNTGDATANNVSVEDDKLGTVPGSPIAALEPGKTVMLFASQFVAATTLNTVTASGNEGSCETSASAAVVAPCVLGYPFTSSDPRTSVAFNESEVLRAFRPPVVGPGERLMVFYNDEHALTLGARQVLVKSNSGTVTTGFPFTVLMSSPDGVVNPQVGTMQLDGDLAGTDTNKCAGFPDLCDRPLFPALFITDITDDPNSRAGDWQFGGTPIGPNAVFGTWKGAVRTVDKTKNPPFITVTPDRDPAKNNYNLDGGDPAPTGLVNQGYGAEIAWDVDTLLADGVIQRERVYRVQFMVHDGDQNKVGGDTGEGCATVFVR